MVGPARREATTVDGDRVDICLVRNPADESTTLAQLGTGPSSTAKTVIVLRSMGPRRRREFSDEIKELGLSVRPLRREEIRETGPPGSTGLPVPKVVRAAAVAVFSLPNSLVQGVLRMVGRGQRVLLVEGRRRGSGAQPPDSGVREPAGPSPSAPSTSIAVEP